MVVIEVPYVIGCGQNRIGLYKGGWAIGGLSGSLEEWMGEKCVDREILGG